MTGKEQDFKEFLVFLTCRIAKDEAGSPHPLGWG